MKCNVTLSKEVLYFATVTVDIPDGLEFEDDLVSIMWKAGLDAKWEPDSTSYFDYDIEN